MPTPKFAIFYADGSLHEAGGPNDELVPVTIMVSRDWLAAPNMGALAVIVEDKRVGRRVYKGADYIYPLGNSQYGTADNLIPWLHGTMKGAVKFGEWVNDDRFIETIQRVKHYQGIDRTGTDNGPA